MIKKDEKKIGEEKKMVIVLFSLDSYDFWPILMADFLLHDFLHIFIYDAAKRAHVVQRIQLLMTAKSDQDSDLL